MSAGGLIFDLDGTLILGELPLPGAKELLEALQQEGIPYAVLTNNSSLSARDHAARLRRLGLPVEWRRIFTSGAFAGRELAQRFPNLPVYLLGTPALAAELAEAGVWVSEEEPQAVLVGFDRTLSYARLERACFLLERGARFFATHPDPACPVEGGALPDAGALLALLEKATGRRPERVFGKPDPAFLRYATFRLGLAPEDCLYVGDRAEVDLPLAQGAGARAALVLTGATRPEDPGIPELRQHGVLVVDDLWELKRHILG
ncbi:acid sugar phosphatase [Thermus composti]|uniref:HAD-IIA family hydrolase n=1 Tax=Thermus composti TaxID=532059 RepID=A0ABV6Q169_9DEIN|nr:HAD-IIA family hydrolase [Thermus composti]GGN04868.1 acid sugar phosphatase [Thermus composti]